MNDDNVRENAFVLINPENIFRFFSAESLVEQENPAELFLPLKHSKSLLLVLFHIPFPHEISKTDSCINVGSRQQCFSIRFRLSRISSLFHYFYAHIRGVS